MTTTMTMPDIQVTSPYRHDIASHVRIGSKPLTGYEDAMEDGQTVVITENDVLLGRGGKKNQHTGNEKLRLLATKYSSFYRAALKREKPVIALLLVRLVQTTKPSGRFLKQTGVEGWEVVSEEVAREKVSQCLRDIVAVVSKFGDQGEDQRCLTSEALLSRMELVEANAFVRASVAALAGQPTEFDRESSFSGPLLKRSRSVPNSDSDVDRQYFSKRTRRQYASLSELAKETFGAYSYKNTTFSALPSHQLPLGELRLELPNSNYSFKSPVWESCYNGKASENACVNQALSKADQLKNDDSAFHRLIDRMILEEQ